MNTRILTSAIAAFLAGGIVGYLLPHELSHADRLRDHRVVRLELENDGLRKQNEILEKMVATMMDEREQVRRALEKAAK